MKRTSAILLILAGSILFLSGLGSFISVIARESIETIGNEAAGHLLSFSLGALVAILGREARLEARNR